MYVFDRDFIIDSFTFHIDHSRWFILTKWTIVTEALYIHYTTIALYVYHRNSQNYTSDRERSLIREWV